MLLDNSIPNQTYVEDCEVCCNPIEIKTIFFNKDLQDFTANSIEQ